MMSQLPKEDLQRQIRIAKLKIWEKQGHSFVEIVMMYNATFGTDHFAEIFGMTALPEKKRNGKQLAKDIHDVMLGEDGFLGF